MRVNTTESIKIRNLTPDGKIRGGLRSETLGDGTGANMIISTPNLFLEHGGLIDSRNFGQASGGNIQVDVADSIQAIGLTSVASGQSGFLVANYSSGESGNIAGSSQNLTLRDGAVLLSLIAGTGLGGEVIVNVTNSIKVSGINPFFANRTIIGANVFTLGDANNVTVNTAKLFVGNGTSIYHYLSIG